VSPQGRPKGEQAPKRGSAEGSFIRPQGCPKGERGPERGSAEGSFIRPQGRRRGEQARSTPAQRVAS